MLHGSSRIFKIHAQTSDLTVLWFGMVNHQLEPVALAGIHGIDRFRKRTKVRRKQPGTTAKTLWTVKLHRTSSGVIEPTFWSESFTVAPDLYFVSLLNYSHVRAKKPGRNQSSSCCNGNSLLLLRGDDYFDDRSRVGVRQAEASPQLCHTLPHASDANAHTFRAQLGNGLFNALPIVAHRHHDRQEW